MVRTKCIVFASLDGIASLYSGVGVVVDSVFENFGRIESNLDIGSYAVHAAVPLFNNNTDEFSSTQLRSIELFCDKRGGRVHHLENLCSNLTIPEVWRGTETVKTTEQWNSLCASLGNLTNELLEDYQSLIIICHDTLFANTSAFLNKNLDRIKLCWIPHSLSTLFEDELIDERLIYERNSISAILESGHKIGYISNQTKKILKSQFGVKESSLISFYSGIFFNSKKYQLSDNPEFTELISSVPTDKRVIFTWGRCVYQKGIDLVIDAFREISKRTEEYHLIMICPTSNSTPEYLRLIKNKISLLKKGSYTLFEDYHNELPMLFLNWDKTEYVILASRFEGFGIIAIEAAYICDFSTKILYSSLSTFNEVLEELPNSFSFDVGKVNSITEAFENSKQSFDSNQNANSKGFLRKKYDLLENYSRGIEHLLKSKI
jgi:glycosyltransferase involved in cell wall biosynthesis